MTQSLAEAGRDREDIRSELFRALEAVRLGNSEQDRGERGRGQVDPTCVPRGSLISPVLPLDLGLFSAPAPLDLGGPPPRPPGFFRLLYQGAVHVFDSRHPTGSCEECPASWLPFQGSCYLFSVQRATWEESQRNCAGAGGHLVIVGDLDEQVRSPRRSQAGGGIHLRGRGPGRGARPTQRARSHFPAQGFLSRNTRGRGYWLGLRAVRRVRKIQGYQWVDGVPLSFR